MTKCPNCGKNQLVISSENDRQTIYTCANCGTRVVEKKD